MKKKHDNSQCLSFTFFLKKSCVFFSSFVDWWSVSVLCVFLLSKLHHDWRCLMISFVKKWMHVGNLFVNLCSPMNTKRWFMNVFLGWLCNWNKKRGNSMFFDQWNRHRYDEQVLPLEVCFHDERRCLELFCLGVINLELFRREFSYREMYCLDLLYHEQLCLVTFCHEE